MSEISSRSQSGLGKPVVKPLPKLYEIAITNPRTRETATFPGQGIRLSDAVDGLGNIGPTVGVRLPNGRQRMRHLSLFEEDVPCEEGEAL
ncbi:hypothetical protein Ga0100231_001205 [Opitutaceae bacterium TAV4]|nr:hypothetical protein Ga0100230_011590 [Opitutaceae bacterium TAV3]RRK01452.1 hypothetical protein Ga0100231_001205 [Opitutaceae bacterium TAV4]